MKTIVSCRGTILAVAALFLAGCSGTGDVGLGVGGGETAPDTGLGGDTAVGNAPFLVLDLVSGQARPVAAIDDLATGTTYRTSNMVFRRIRGTSGEFWMGVFEVTQAQWKAIAGSTNTPWTAVSAGLFASAQDAAAAIADDSPAFNLSFDGVRDAIAAYNGTVGSRLAIPTDGQWTDACSGGSASTWSWGESTDRTVIAGYAVVSETQSGVTGPRTVGGRTANASGCYDMHGNVWELTATAGTIRGGSWYDGVMQARTALHPGTADTGLAADAAHALVGVRLVFQP